MNGIRQILKKINKLKQKFLRIIARHFPTLRPFMRYAHQKVLKMFPPRFSGWGMTSRHELAWVDEYNWNNFRQSAQDIKEKYLKKQFEFDKDTDISTGVFDSLLWRHWIISFFVKYAVEFNRSQSNELNLVELGTADGVSAFFTLRQMEECKRNAPNIKYAMHLYDSWGAMREKELLKTELLNVGEYSILSLERTKRNLAEFKDKVFYHQGYIPESLGASVAPDSIIYMHIDLNSAMPTLAGLEFFYPKMVLGGVILFDDYGGSGYPETKEVVDEFFAKKPVILMKLPTGQAIFFLNS